MRTCEIRKNQKRDDELEEKHPQLRSRKQSRKDGQLAAAEGLVQDAIDQDRPKPDLEKVVARIEHLAAHCATEAPQRVMLWLIDDPPFFRATTSIIKESRGSGE